MVPLERLVVDQPAIGIGIAILAYISDYALTLRAAAMYQQHGREVIKFGGSYELTPQFQKDIDALRHVSPRFLVAVVAVAILLSLLWLLTVPRLGEPRLYLLGLGGFVCLQLVVHHRHLRNLFLFRQLRLGGNVTGSISYSREFVLAQSSLEIVLFAVMYFLLAVTTGSWFLAGGAVATLITGLRHRRLAQVERGKRQ